MSSLLGVLLALPLAVQGEALVMVQGYRGEGNDWQTAGVTAALDAIGWSDGGQLRLHGIGTPLRPASKDGNMRYYILELDSQAPLLYQARQLQGHMQRVLRRHEGETVMLLGHSAGGVLARLYMVQHPRAGVSALITIASPHLGTESAEVGLAVGRSPLGWLTRLLGEETLQRSVQLYADLLPEQPGTLLFWLNRQAHPEARYVSVVRDGRRSLIGDLVVPKWNQDMNNVIALRGRAVTIPTGGNHGLQDDDGRLVVRILRRLRGT